jgi:hypothetical protein
LGALEDQGVPENRDPFFVVGATLVLRQNHVGLLSQHPQLLRNVTVTLTKHPRQSMGCTTQGTDKS